MCIILLVLIMNVFRVFGVAPGALILLMVFSNILV